MNIAVCAKSVPTSSVTIEIDPTTKRVIREGVPKELDPAAASAVEEGLRIVEAHGGEVTVVTMGPAEAVDDIRKALAMGAERKEIVEYTAADLGLDGQVGEGAAREKVLTVGKPPAREVGTIITDEGDGGIKIADFLAELKVL